MVDATHHPDRDICRFPVYFLLIVNNSLLYCFPELFQSWCSEMKWTKYLALFAVLALLIQISFAQEEEGSDHKKSNFRCYACS